MKRLLLMVVLVVTGCASGYYVPPQPGTYQPKESQWYYRSGDYLFDASHQRTMPCYDSGSFVYCP